MKNRSNKNNRRNLLNVTFIALFAALCYIALSLFFFPFANMYIHFGNLIVVSASLLIGGWQGGMSGAVGMGIFDIVSGHIDSFPKTFLLKLLIGITVGAVFGLFAKRRKYPVYALIAAAAASFSVTAVCAVFAFKNNGGFKGRSAVLAAVFAAVTLLCLVLAVLGKKLSWETASAAIAAFCGMAVNLAGETGWALIKFIIAGSSFKPALISALLSQSSTLINAAIAITGGTALYKALKNPINKIINR